VAEEASGDVEVEALGVDMVSALAGIVSALTVVIVNLTNGLFPAIRKNAPGAEHS
jgi:hypothetical protein